MCVCVCVCVCDGVHLSHLSQRIKRKKSQGRSKASQKIGSILSLFGLAIIFLDQSNS